MSELVELLQRLVAIDSVNPRLVPGGAGEREIANFIADWLEGKGLEVELDEPAAGRPSVVAIARGAGGGRSLMLNAHIDTVGVAGMERPHDPVISGGRLYGRGAYDMKGSVAACMVTLAAASRRGLHGDLIFTAVSDEEFASIGTQSVLRRGRTDAAIVTEPTGLRVCTAHKGFTWLEIETVGRAAHGSRPDLGVDSIVKMGHALVALEALDRSLRAVPSHPLLGSGSLHASLIQGGQELSSYPERCHLSVERRTIPGETREVVEQELREMLQRATASDPDFVATLRTTLVRDPFEVSPGRPIVQTLLQQAEMVLGARPEIVGDTPWMDSALLAAAGIPTVVFGPGGGGAHAIEEWVELDDVERCARILLATAVEFCA